MDTPSRGERTGVLDPTIGERLDHAARAKAFFELRILRVIGMLGLFLCIQVIQIAEELIETVIGQ